MGEILEIVFFMWIIAVISFAPLAYFIYIFTKGNAESFGKSNPDDHAVEHTSYYKHIDFVLSTLLGGTNSSSPAVNATPAAASKTSTTTSSAPRPRPKPRTETVEKKAKDKKKKAKK